MSDYKLTTKFGWHEIYRKLSITMKKWEVHSWDVNEPAGVRNPRDYNQSEEDRRVIIDYKLRGKNIRLIMDQQNTARDNFRVLTIALEAMRMNERRGIGEIMESAYLQLSGAVANQTPYEVLGIMPDSPIDVAEAVYRAKAKIAHPDQGGSKEQMAALSKAIEDIRKL